MQASVPSTVGVNLKLTQLKNDSYVILSITSAFCLNVSMAGDNKYLFADNLF